VRNITIRDSFLKGTNLAVRLKTMRGRGGGIEDVLYENLQGSVESAIQITLNYHTTPATNLSATPTIRDITLKNIRVKATQKSDLTCDGLSDSKISGITFQVRAGLCALCPVPAPTCA